MRVYLGYIKYVLQSGKFWLVPLLIVMFVFGLISVLAGTSPVTPFLYAIF